jgi:hypothetical protein
MGAFGGLILPQSPLASSNDLTSVGIGCILRPNTGKGSLQLPPPATLDVYTCAEQPVILPPAALPLIRFALPGSRREELSTPPGGTYEVYRADATFPCNLRLQVYSTEKEGG